MQEIELYCTYLYYARDILANVTWCSAMAVKSGITCNALEWWSHHKKRTGFVGLVYNYLTITKT